MGSHPQLESGCRQDLKPAALTTVIITHAWIQQWPSLLYLLACLSELLHCLSENLLRLSQSDPAVKEGGAGHVLP